MKKHCATSYFQMCIGNHRGIVLDAIKRKFTDRAQELENAIFSCSQDMSYPYAQYAYNVLGIIFDSQYDEIVHDIHTGRIEFSFTYFDKYRQKKLECIRVLNLKPEGCEGIATCRHCGGTKFWKWQLQTRGLDEMMTTYLQCVKCPSEKGRFKI